MRWAEITTAARPQFGFLSTLQKGLPVTCDPVGEDRYGRTLAVCSLYSRLGLNAELVRRGVAIAFRRYERAVRGRGQARAARAGLSDWIV